VGIFDHIEYCKAACLIKMLEAYVGGSTFRKGMTLFLKKHHNSVASPADLWAAFAEVSRLDIASLMQNWISLTGYVLSL
jgi:aminopeptidase N